MEAREEEQAPATRASLRMRIEADEADALGRAERDRPSLEGVSFGAFPDDLELELRIGFHRLDRERDALHGEEPRQYPRAADASPTLREP